ncbi:hypothetical protein C5167_031346 [Papaver somniferum]|uniref:Uncharacterized protein n=1 Tax=Papaver somniferum TaxID=3469 RepID=A0A4Y7K6X6_PAPSO|nr:hypothetical protein C5167_031346 [Papaver somniferum]
MSWYKDTQQTRPYSTFINSEGLVISNKKYRYIVSREDPNSPVYKLPTLLQAQQNQQKAEKEALEKRVSDLETTLKDKETDITGIMSSSIQLEETSRA